VTFPVTARLDEIDNQWQNLVDLAALRKQRLNEAVDFYQFFADADDVDHWMVDTLRIVSSDDVGKDEASAQSLLKKHKVSSLLFTDRADWGGTMIMLVEQA